MLARITITLTTISSSMIVNPAVLLNLFMSFRPVVGVGLACRHRCRRYQSRYLVPSSAVPWLFEYTSYTFWPPHVVESGLSWYARRPHSLSPVIGSTGILRRNFSLRPVASLATDTPSTSVSRSGGYPSLLALSSVVGIMPASAASLNLSIAVRISRSTLRNSASRVRWIVTFASGCTADARIRMIVVTTSNSTNENPRCSPFTTFNFSLLILHLPDGDAGGNKLQCRLIAARHCCRSAQRQRSGAGGQRLYEQRREQAGR